MFSWWREIFFDFLGCFLFSLSLYLSLSHFYNQQKYSQCISFHLLFRNVFNEAIEETRMIRIARETFTLEWRTWQSQKNLFFLSLCWQPEVNFKATQKIESFFSPLLQHQLPLLALKSLSPNFRSKLCEDTFTHHHPFHSALSMAKVKKNDAKRKICFNPENYINSILERRSCENQWEAKILSCINLHHHTIIPTLVRRSIFSPTLSRQIFTSLCPCLCHTSEKIKCIRIGQRVMKSDCLVCPNIHQHRKNFWAKIFFSGTLACEKKAFACEEKSSKGKFRSFSHKLKNEFTHTHTRA